MYLSSTSNIYFFRFHRTFNKKYPEFPADIVRNRKSCRSSRALFRKYVIGPIIHHELSYVNFHVQSSMHSRTDSAFVALLQARSYPFVMRKKIAGDFNITVNVNGQDREIARRRRRSQILIEFAGKKPVLQLLLSYVRRLGRTKSAGFLKEKRLGEKKQF